MLAYTCLPLEFRVIPMSPVIFWFRRNLRLHDNLALDAAAESGRPVVPVYISDELDTGGASRWWLHHSLAALAEDLKECGGGLVVRTGEPEDLLPRIAAEIGADSLYFCNRYEPLARDQERALGEVLEGGC